MSAFDDLQRQALIQLTEALANTPWVLIGASALACQMEMDWRRTNDLDIVLVVGLAALPRAFDQLEGWHRDPKRNLIITSA